jgi:hypothetical protein
MWQPNFVPALGFPLFSLSISRPPALSEDRECHLGNLYIAYIAWDNSGRASD